MAVGASALILIAAGAAGAQTAASAPAGAAPAAARLNKYGYPEKHTPEPTTAAITAADLMTRLYIFADDSMQGRKFGTLGNYKGTTYIGNEVKRLGLLPMGDSGTYFQRLPVREKRFTSASTMTVDGAKLVYLTDFVPPPTAAAPKPIQTAQVVFGGNLGDTTTLISPEAAAGKFVVLLPANAGGAGGRGGRGGGGGGGGGRGGAGGRAGGGGAPVNPCMAVLGGPPAAGAAPAGGGAGGRGGAAGGFGAAGGGAAAIDPATRYANAAGIAIVDLDATPFGDRAVINTNSVRAEYAGPGQRSPRAPVVVVKSGQIATLDNGVLVGGKLPAGMTGKDVQQMMDSISADTTSRMRRAAASAALERYQSCVVEDSIAVSHGATSMKGPNSAPPDANAAGGGRRGGGGGGGGAGGAGGGGRAGAAAPPAGAAGAAGAAVAAAGGGGRGGRGGRGGGGAAPNGPAPVASIRMTAAAAEKLFGKPVAGLATGTMGKTVTANLVWEDFDAGNYARNVVAMVPGSDPLLKNEYVLVSAHNDHNGYTTNPQDHDSLKAAYDLGLRAQLSVRAGDLAPPQGGIVVNMDSLRKIRPARKDSIQNGADDDGSGSMGILEIAEYIAKMPVKPKRSILFVWQTGEEAGLYGSAYFAAHPTVPIDSIVADINIDMIGRGRAEDIPGGGPNYLGVVGAGFLSTELQQIVATNNAKQKMPLDLDPKFDLPTTWPGYNNIYGRSDHYNYAKQCIPIAFFFTGLHGDYHKVTDEPQYIDYPHYSMIDNYIRDIVVDLGTRAQRPSMDKPCVR